MSPPMTCFSLDPVYGWWSRGGVHRDVMHAISVITKEEGTG